MGIDANFGAAFAKGLLGADHDLQREGMVFVSVRDEDKRMIVPMISRLHSMGFKIIATSGTAHALKNSGIPTEKVLKIHEGRPHVLDLIKNRQVKLIINTPSGRIERSDDRLIRSSSVLYKIPCITTVAAASATIQGLEWLRQRRLDVRPIQDYHKALALQK